MDRIKEMTKTETATEILFKKLGVIQWDGNDAFVVTTKQKVKLVLCPNECLENETPKQVIVDEIYVPWRLRRKGNATKTLTVLCRLADKHRITLLGGPIGFSESAWRDKYVEWVLRFGFERDPSEHLKSHDPKVFYVRRLPRQRLRPG